MNLLRWRSCAYCCLGASLPNFARGFAPSRAIGAASSTRTMTATTSAFSSTAAIHAINDDGHDRSTLSVAILGGGIAGVSCASQLLSRHKEFYDPSSSSRYELEVTLFDTGRLRPGGRCSSRLPGDVPAVVKNRSSGKYPVKQDDRNNRRACDDEGISKNSDDDGGVQIPENIRRALDGALSSSQHETSSRDRIVTGMGPVDHAAQILSVPQIDSSFIQFQSQLEQWLEEGVVESFPENSVCELLNEGENGSKLQPLKGEMYYGKGGMGNIPIAMRDRCLSFTQFGDRYTGQSFRILHDVWVSPSNGVKYIGDDDDTDLIWELRAGKKSLGKYHRLVIAHNGKCADRIMSRTPARAFHSLLRTKFAPYVPEWGGREMTLNSIYSLAFAIKSEKGDDGGGGGVSPIGEALSRLSSSSSSPSSSSPSSSSQNKDVYTVMIKNEPDLRLLSCNTLKHHHVHNPNSDSAIEVYTLLSSAQFGKKFKGPQENLPPDLVEKVVVKLLGSLERSLHMEEGCVVEKVVDLRLQLWGAGVPVNTWKSGSDGNGGVDGFVYDAAHGVGACGDWILDPSIAGAWESGRRLASWMLDSKNHGSVGLPDRSSEGGGKFVPSRASLESGIGTVPSSPDAPGFKFPSNEQNNGSRSARRGSGQGRGGRGRGGRGRGGRGRGGRGSRTSRAEGGKRGSDSKNSRPAQPISQ